MSSELITEHLDLWTSAVTYKNGKGRGNNGEPEQTGIQKLRELILELAVRGKLVPQDPDDEPASKLLERIEEKKWRLYKEGKIKKPKKLPEIAEEEKPFKLPKGWLWSRLEKIAQINPRNHVDDSLEVGFVPMALVGMGHKGEHGLETRKWVQVKKGYTHFADGDIALAKITPCFENSKAVVFSRLTNGVGAGTTELHVARPYSELINPFFVLLNLKSPRFIELGKSEMTGSAGQKRVPKDYFANTSIPLPPHNEQARIVEKVDELMALCDRLEQQASDQISAHETLVDTLLDTLTCSQDAAELADNWASLAKHFDTLFTTEHSIDRIEQTILQLAVMGRLVLQDPNEEPASKLLERIWSEKNRLPKEGKIKKWGKPTEVEKKELSGPVPEGWVAIRFEDLTQEISTGPFGSMLHRSDYVQNGVPLVNPSHMIDGKIVEDYNAAIKGEKLEELEGYFLNEGDIVMARRGDLGRCALVTEREDGWICGTGSFILRFHQDINRKYIQILFQTVGVRSYLSGESVGTTMTNLNHRILKKMPLMVPPVAEQERIVEKVTELRTLCDRLKDQLVKAGEIQGKLAESIVKRAVA